jgi:hypothetical protein
VTWLLIRLKWHGFGMPNMGVNRGKVLGEQGNKGKCARNVMARDAVIVRQERVKIPVGYMQTMKSFGGWGNLFILLAFPRICSTPQAT